AEPKTLIDFRIDPEFGALPQPHAQKCSRVPGFAALVWNEAVPPDIGRPEWRRILLDEGRLAVHGERAGIKRLGAFGKNLRVNTIATELETQPDPQRVDGEIGGKTLRASGKVPAARSIIGEKIFEPRHPVWCQRNFDSAAHRTADPRHHEQILDRTGHCRAADSRACNLCARELIETGGEATRCIKQPMAGRVADAAAHRA